MSPRPRGSGVRIRGSCRPWSTPRGGGAAIIRPVQCSVPSIQTRDKALEVVCRSLNHRRRDYIAQLGQNADFIAFFSIRWAPPNARNDPTHLNENWANNVRQLWGVA